MTEYQKKWWKDNKDKCSEYNKKFRDKNPNSSKNRAKKWREDNPEQVKKLNKQLNMKREANGYRRNWRLMKDFGMTNEDWNLLYNNQNGYCPICGKHQLELKKSLAVDHNHTTGIIRGLLCHQCNLLLGNAKENINTLLNAIEYLKTH